MSHRFDYDLGIIGGGAAGLTAASGAARLGAKTLLIEKEEKLGGDCLHYGCVPSKALIHSAKALHTIKDSQRYGLPRVDPGPVDYARIRQRIIDVISVIQKHDSEERFCRLGAEVRFGRARFVDEHSIQLESRKLSAAKWLIATGSSPAVPPIPGLNRTSYITNKELFYLDRLPESMIVLGGGPIAVEMAQAMNRLGVKVSVIQRSPQILTREDRDMADQLLQILQAEGVDFYLGASAAGVRDHGRQKEILFKQANGDEKRVTAETILVALGRTPNTEGLDLENAGVKFGPRGIQVDARLRTSQKHIFAAGDITGDYQFTHTAGYESGIVLANAIFRLPRKADYTIMPWCTYTDPELASVGLNEKRAALAGIDHTVWTEEFSGNDRSLTMGNTNGKIKMILNNREKVIGVQILGPSAGELINEWVAALSGKIKLTTLASAVHPYPTLGEISKRVAGSYLAPKIFSKKIQKGLKFFFSLKGRSCS
ncbi:dihydrolipoyl dehydrogenase family protein [Desulfonatronovibrio hydrogenovorans]|uniref:dihydrolipoyl dehydrogenase family protein n=1 Tax=Desulfonatronovibrio hydrogenovorans TaxID=53245 RepID=UPI0004915A68|nr:FAD-dependent oxidoreductase [Desulfonatronovibrio hydrogenovorans]